ncbi:MAG TPA: 4a-hydroxytetrahydrobiopterin dehydratase [Verrucomicrobiae bacterium]
METNLAKKSCTDVKENTPLNDSDIATYKERLDIGWRVLEGKKLQRDFKFSDFKEALKFVNQVGEMADLQNHHPDIHLSYGEATVELTTHAAGGLTQNDFILAAKVDTLGRAETN